MEIGRFIHIFMRNPYDISLDVLSDYLLALFEDIMVTVLSWQSPTRTLITEYERAAQFSSFIALADYEEMVGEEVREVDTQEELTETEMEILNHKINLIVDVIEDGYHLILTFTYIQVNYSLVSSVANKLYFSTTHLVFAVNSQKC